MENWTDSFEYHLAITAGERTKEAAKKFRVDVSEENCQKARKPEARFTWDLRKQPAELNASLEETAARKQTEKRLRVSIKKLEWPQRVHPEAVLINPAERVSYVAILKDLRCALNLINWASQFRELGRRVLRTC